LQGEVELRDLVDQQRAAVGLLNHPCSPLGSTRSSARDVPEQLTFEQLGRHSGAVEHDERAIGARPLLMQALRQELFSGARIAFDDHRDIRLRELLAQRIESAHLRAGADHPPPRRGGG
jgi:hypothetical protein